MQPCGARHRIKLIRHLFCGLLPCLQLPGTAWAAGGHHAIDDAAVIAPGECQLELWIDRQRGRSLEHVGPACHWKGLELGINLEHASARGESSTWLVAPQIKWAADVHQTLGVGIVLTATRQSQAPKGGYAVLVPLSWRPEARMALHLNLGLDWARGERTRTHRGAAIEWTPAERWLTVAEWAHDGNAPLARVGLRYLATPASTWDLSYARAGIWTLGWNRTFAQLW